MTLPLHAILAVLAADAPTAARHDIDDCMRSVTVKHGAFPDLEVSALRTVGQWRYTPTLLDGQPVSVIMTITVNDRLN